eukprot:2524126-Rhodomonas_salina.1
MILGLQVLTYGYGPKAFSNKVLGISVLTQAYVTTRACRFRSGSNRTWTPRFTIGLRPCYAISGTDLAHGAIGLRACYAVSGTEISGTELVYGAVCLRACYVMP